MLAADLAGHPPTPCRPPDAGPVSTDTPPFRTERRAARYAGGALLTPGLERRPFTGRLTYYLGEVNTVHPFRVGNGRFFEQLARDAGFTLAWQHLDAARNIEASAAVMRGDVNVEPMRKMLDTLVTDGNQPAPKCRELTDGTCK